VGLGNSMTNQAGEQRYQTLQAGLDLLDQGITVFDAQLRLVAWNQAFLRLLDFPENLAFVGASFESFMRYNASRGEYGDDHEAQVVKRVQAASSFAPHDIERTRPDGRILRARGQPLPGYGFITLYSDVTEQRRAEETIRKQNTELEDRVAERTVALQAINQQLQAASEANQKIANSLRRSEAQMRLITDSIPALIAYFDANKVYRYINRGYQEWFGLDPENPGKISAKEYLGPQVYGRIRGNVAQALAGEAVTFEYELVIKSGKDVAVRTTLIPERAPDGDVVGCFELTFDITEQRRTHQVMAQAEKMEALGQLTGGLAHDFNNILTVIIGNLEGLRGVLQHPELTNEYVSPALSAAKRGTELIRGLMTFSRRQSLQAQPVEMNSALHSICRLVKRSLPERINLTHDAPQAPAWAMVDANQFENVLVNLIINARDSIDLSGRVHLSIDRVDLTHEQAAVHRVSAGPFVRIDVIDSGSGMDAQTLSRVFEPFFTTKPVGKGTGLGMAMVYGFIKQSGGCIHIDSIPGQGTTVSLWLPATQPIAIETELDEHIPASSDTNKGLAVLVEDDAQVRKIVRRHLIDMGYSVIEAENGDDAHHLITHTSMIELLISDIVMPGQINGRDLARYAKDHHLAHHVALMTGYAPEESSEVEIPTITKPFSKKQLFDFLNRLAP
jgi:PAS domain S-box-containing protein